MSAIANRIVNALDKAKTATATMHLSDCEHIFIEEDKLSLSLSENKKRRHDVLLSTYL